MTEDKRKMEYGKWSAITHLHSWLKFFFLKSIVSRPHFCYSIQENVCLEFRLQAVGLADRKDRLKPELQTNIFLNVIAYAPVRFA